MLGLDIHGQLMCPGGLQVIARDSRASRLLAPTSSSLIATQLFEGNPWSIGTRNWRQPDQWPTKSIIQIKLKIRMNTEAMFRNWKSNMLTVFENWPWVGWGRPSYSWGSLPSWGWGSANSRTSGRAAASRISDWLVASTTRLTSTTERGKFSKGLIAEKNTRTEFLHLTGPVSCLFLEDSCPQSDWVFNISRGVPQSSLPLQCYHL